MPKTDRRSNGRLSDSRTTPYSKTYSHFPKYQLDKSIKNSIKNKIVFKILSQTTFKWVLRENSFMVEF